MKVEPRKGKKILIIWFVRWKNKFSCFLLVRHHFCIENNFSISSSYIFIGKWWNVNEIEINVRHFSLNKFWKLFSSFLHFSQYATFSICVSFVFFLSNFTSLFILIRSTRVSLASLTQPINVSIILATLFNEIL